MKGSQDPDLFAISGGFYAHKKTVTDVLCPIAPHAGHLGLIKLQRDTFTELEVIRSVQVGGVKQNLGGGCP